MSDVERFSGRHVLVTGGSRGLGRAMAIAFAREGGFVHVGYRTHVREAREALASIEAAGGTGALVQIDVRDQGSVTSAVEGVLTAHGKIDVLVNNAGIAADAPFAMMPPDDFESVIATNLTGAFRCCRAVVRGMMAAGSGAIVNVASVAGLHASPGQANYAASKGGLIAMTRTLAAEVAPFRVRVNALLPGFISAGMALRVDRRIADAFVARIPAKRLGTADEIANVALFLASDAASYVIGQALVVDGGLTA